MLCKNKVSRKRLYALWKSAVYENVPVRPNGHDRLQINWFDLMTNMYNWQFVIHLTRIIFTLRYSSGSSWIQNSTISQKPIQ